MSFDNFDSGVLTQKPLPDLIRTMADDGHEQLLAAIAAPSRITFEPTTPLATT